MSLVIAIVAFGIYFASLFSLLGVGGAILFKPHRSVFIRIHLFMIAVWLFFGASAAAGFKDAFPFNIFSTGLFCYCIAIPCMYFDFCKALDPSFKLKWRHLPHVLCPLILLVYLIRFHQKYGGLYAALSFRDIYYHSPGNIFYSGIVYVPLVAFIIEISLMVYKATRLKLANVPTPLDPISSTIFILFLNLLQCLIWIIDKVFALGWLWFLYLLSGSFIIAYFFIIIKEMGVIISLNRAGGKKQNSKSTLKNIDEEKTLEKLNSVLREEKVYRDEAVNLETLASVVGIGSHQLSELINTHFHKNFSSFISFNRIEEAKKILLAEPKKSIVDIGFDVGFNSTSSFYRVFKQEMGCSPSDFRKKYAKKSDDFSG